MSETLQSILYIIAGGIVLILSVVILRFFFKYAWKVIRVVLIILAILLIAGYILGFVDITLPL
jgi:hypothetical protein